MQAVQVWLQVWELLQQRGPRLHLLTPLRTGGLEAEQAASVSLLPQPPADQQQHIVPTVALRAQQEDKLWLTRVRVCLTGSNQSSDSVCVV